MLPSTALKVAVPMGITDICTHTHTHTHRNIGLSFSWNVLPYSPPPSSPTRRGVFHLQCQKSHPRAPTTTRLWPEIVHWRAQRNSGRRPGSAWWLPKELRPYGKTQPRRALTALRSTYLRLRHGYEDITTGTHRADKQYYTKHNTTKMYGCPHQCTVGV